MIAWIALGWSLVILLITFATARNRIPQSAHSIYLVLSLLLINDICKALTWKQQQQQALEHAATEWILARVASCYLLALRVDSWMILMQRAWTTSSAITVGFLSCTKRVFRVWQGYLLSCVALVSSIVIVLWAKGVLAWSETVVTLAAVDAGLWLISVVLLGCTQYIVYLLRDEFKEVPSFATIEKFQTFLLCATIGAGLASALVASVLLTVEATKDYDHLDQVAVLFWPLVPVSQVISLSFFYISHITYTMQQRESGTRRNSLTLISLNLPSNAV